MVHVATYNLFYLYIYIFYYYSTMNTLKSLKFQVAPSTFTCGNLFNHVATFFKSKSTISGIPVLGYRIRLPHDSRIYLQTY
jgi:hypothetical protein